MNLIDDFGTLLVVGTLVLGGMFAAGYGLTSCSDARHGDEVNPNPRYLRSPVGPVYVKREPRPAPPAALPPSELLEECVAGESGCELQWVRMEPCPSIREGCHFRWAR